MKNGFLSINDVFLIITVSLTFLMAILLHLMPEKEKHFKNDASLFCAMWGVSLIAVLFIWNPFLQASSLNSSVMGPFFFSTATLLQPIFFIRLIVPAASKKEFSWLVWGMHLIPVGVVASLILIYQINVTKWVPFYWGDLSSDELLAVKISWAVTRTLPLLYGVGALVYLAINWRKSQVELNSKLKTIMGLSYPGIFALGFTLWGLWSAITFWVGFGLDVKVNVLLGEWGIYLQWMFAGAMLFLGYDSLRRWMIVDEGVVAEVVSRGAAQKEVDNRIAIIDAAIFEKKIYLDAHLNLERFSEKIGMRSRDVSALLNSHYKMNFFEFINHHRVEEAKRLLVEHQQATVVDIIYKAGFNSQSAFHRFFKRFAGVTPSEYRHSHNLDASLLLKAG